MTNKKRKESNEEKNTPDNEFLNLPDPVIVKIDLANSIIRTDLKNTARYFGIMAGVFLRHVNKYDRFFINKLDEIRNIFTKYNNKKEEN